MNEMQQTIAYYDSNASRFVTDTVNVEFSALQEKFTSMLPEGSRILDLGCGSGRDSLAFSNAGFQVDAVDGSAAMVKAARKLTGLPVIHALFADYEPEAKYDGIWACSSLLHVPKAELPTLIHKYAKSLKPGGIFYLGFKLGNHEGMRNGRWFTDLEETTLKATIEKAGNLKISEITITPDARPNRENEKWLNAWCINRPPA